MKEKIILLFNKGVKPLGQMILPHNKSEKILLCVSMIYFYIIWGVFIILRNEYLHINIMGYDTIPNISQYGFPYVHCWHLRHPLFAIFYLPQTCIAWLLERFSIDYRLITYTIVTPAIFAFNNLLVLKILRELLPKGNNIGIYLSIALFSSFAHVILLAGQYETFPLSMLLLVLSLLYLSNKQNTLQDNILFALIAGVTSTNGIKLFIAWMWECSFAKFVKRGIKSVCLFSICMLLPTLQLILATLRHGDFYGHFITNSTGFSHTEYSTFSALKDNFFSEPLFFHNLGAIIYDPRITYSAVRIPSTSIMDNYLYPFINVCIIVIYVVATMGLLMNFRTKIVKVMVSFLLADLFVLLILGYGKDEAQLFCLHWIFILPLAIGLLYGKLKKQASRIILTTVLLLVTTIAFCYNMTAYITSLTTPLTYDNYEYQLNLIRGNSDNLQNLKSSKFFLFGMGERRKMVYRENRLIDLNNQKVVRIFEDIQTDRIIPDEYKVILTKKDGSEVIISEDEKGVWLKEGNSLDSIEGTMYNVSLPNFSSYRYGRVLKVLHHEILFNIKNSELRPNLYAYDKVWYRDCAMGAMVLEKTGNIKLIKNSVLSLNTLYDGNQQTSEGKEADNIGEYLYLKGLFSTKLEVKTKKLILSELRKIEKNCQGRKYITSVTDGQQNDYYATAFLKYALRRNNFGLKDEYMLPSSGEAYKTLTWFYSKATTAEIIKHCIKKLVQEGQEGHDDFPYLSIASAHYYGECSIPIPSSSYPLSWESNGKLADINNMYRIDPMTKENRSCYPHTWTAAEMFLYLYDANK